ncbi:hypothetical protein DFH27DRAFT_241554 [Peziza echinospora]|nr:hypothetical protein DFH27DRAFT_241554 [Peziza echinospora]
MSDPLSFFLLVLLFRISSVKVEEKIPKETGGKIIAQTSRDMLHPSLCGDRSIGRARVRMEALWLCLLASNAIAISEDYMETYIMRCYTYI